MNTTTTEVLTAVATSAAIRATPNVARIAVAADVVGSRYILAVVAKSSDRRNYSLTVCLPKPKPKHQLHR